MTYIHIFGILSDAKLSDVIMSEYSPVKNIHSCPEILLYYMSNNIGISKYQTKEWFAEYFNG